MSKTELRIGILGAGPWGRNLFRSFLRSPRAAVTAICDTNPARALELAPPGTSLRAYSDATSLLEHENLDAVVVATPAQTHVPLVVDAVNAGYHVFVEKPMALASADARRLCLLSRLRARKLMVGHVLLYHPAVDELVAQIRAGELGTIVEVHTQRFSASHRARNEGAWWSLAPHDVSLMRHLLRAEPTAISVVTSDIAADRNEFWKSPLAPLRAVSGRNSTRAALFFANGVTGTIEVGLSASDDVRLVVVIGTERTAVFDDRAVEAKLTLFDTSAEAQRGRGRCPVANASTRLVPCSSEEPLAVEVRRFVELILDDRPVPSDGGEGCAVTSILELGAISLAARGALQNVCLTDHATMSVDFERRPHCPNSLPFDTVL